MKRWTMEETLGEFLLMAEVDVVTIDRRPTRFYRDNVSPNAGPTLPPTSRAGHRTRQTFSASWASCDADLSSQLPSVGDIRVYF